MSTGFNKNLSLTWLRNLPILLPPLAEQRAIAAVLDAIDEAIERTEAVVAATERLRDALLHELLTRGVPGWHTAWKEAPGIGTIPASWEVVRLGEVRSLSLAVLDEPGPLGTFDPMERSLSGGNIAKGTIEKSDAILVLPASLLEAVRTPHP